MRGKTLIIRPILIGVVALFVTTGSALGDGRDFDLPASEVGNTLADGGLDLEDMDFEGNPLKRFAEKWPDDLVIAPVPGRSPQVGWSLALGGGYFLESKDEDSDVAPSVLGGFGWYAENGSYAFGLGGNLHLLDDDLRVKFGAGYMDVRYRFYGIGNDSPSESEEEYTPRSIGAAVQAQREVVGRLREAPEMFRQVRVRQHHRAQSQRHRDAEAVGALAELLKDADAKQAAARALGSIGTPEAAKALEAALPLQLLDGVDEDTAVRAQTLLQMVGAVVDIETHRLEVRELDGRRIARVRAK